MSQGKEVEGRTEGVSYWVSLILSFVSLWIAFVYSVSSGQEFLRQKACIHAGIFRWRFLLVLLLTWLSSSLQPSLKGGLEMFNLLRIFPIRGRGLKTVTRGPCVNDFSDEERGWCWVVLNLPSTYNFFMLVESLVTMFDTLNEIPSPFGCCFAMAQGEKEPPVDIRFRFG